MCNAELDCDIKTPVVYWSKRRWLCCTEQSQSQRSGTIMLCHLTSQLGKNKNTDKPVTSSCSSGLKMKRSTTRTYCSSERKMVSLLALITSSNIWGESRSEKMIKLCNKTVIVQIKSYLIWFLHRTTIRTTITTTIGQQRLNVKIPDPRKGLHWSAVQTELWPESCPIVRRWWWWGRVMRSAED